MQMYKGVGEEKRTGENGEMCLKEGRRGRGECKSRHILRVKWVRAVWREREEGYFTLRDSNPLDFAPTRGRGLEMWEKEEENPPLHPHSEKKEVIPSPFPSYRISKTTKRAGRGVEGQLLLKSFTQA
jgi:hypothetical protein